MDIYEASAIILQGYENEDEDMIIEAFERCPEIINENNDENEFRSWLHDACAEGYYKVVLKLLEMGHPVNIVNIYMDFPGLPHFQPEKINREDERKLHQYLEQHPDADIMFSDAMFYIDRAMCPGCKTTGTLQDTGEPVDGSCDHVIICSKCKFDMYIDMF